MKIAAVLLVAALSTPLAAAAQTSFPAGPGNAYVSPPHAPGAPTSPTILSPDGDVLVTGSVGLSRTAPLPQATSCIVPHGVCPLPPVTVQNQVCECFVPGVGAEQGTTR